MFPAFSRLLGLRHRLPVVDMPVAGTGGMPFSIGFGRKARIENLGSNSGLAPQKELPRSRQFVISLRLALSTAAGVRLLFFSKEGSKWNKF
jgi:hypothetical protein